MRHKFYRESLIYLKEAQNNISDYKISNNDLFYLNHATKHLEYSLEFLLKYILIMFKDPFDSYIDKDGHNIEQLRSQLELHKEFYSLLDDDNLKLYSGMITGWKSKNFYSEFNTKISIQTINKTVKIIEEILDKWESYRNLHNELIEFEDNYYED